MEPWVVDLVRALAPMILGGSAWVGWGQYKKSKAEAQKTRTEAEKLERDMGTDSDLATANVMKEAVETMRSIAADANDARQRAQDAEDQMRVDLERERAGSRELWDRVRAMENREREKDRRITTLEASEQEKSRKIGVLEASVLRLGDKLVQARLAVESLVTYIETHTPQGTDNMPKVDYSIFEP